MSARARWHHLSRPSSLAQNCQKYWVGKPKYLGEQKVVKSDGVLARAAPKVCDWTLSRDDVVFNSIVFCLFMQSLICIAVLPNLCAAAHKCAARAGPRGVP